MLAFHSPTTNISKTNFLDETAGVLARSFFLLKAKLHDQHFIA
jgi:hypothetical protein